MLLKGACNITLQQSAPLFGSDRSFFSAQNIKGSHGLCKFLFLFLN